MHEERQENPEDGQSSKVQNQSNQHLKNRRYLFFGKDASCCIRGDCRPDCWLGPWQHAQCCTVNVDSINLSETHKLISCREIYQCWNCNWIQENRADVDCRNNKLDALDRSEKIKLSKMHLWAVEYLLQGLLSIILPYPIKSANLINCIPFP